MISKYRVKVEEHAGGFILYTVQRRYWLLWIFWEWVDISVPIASKSNALEDLDTWKRHEVTRRRYLYNSKENK